MLANNAKWWQGDNTCKVIAGPIDIRKTAGSKHDILAEINQKVVVQKYALATNISGPICPASTLGIEVIHEHQKPNFHLMKTNRAFCQMWIPSSVLIKLMAHNFENIAKIILVSHLDSVLISAITQHRGILPDDYRDGLIESVQNIVQASGQIPSKLSLDHTIQIGLIVENPKVAPTHIYFKQLNNGQYMDTILINPVFKFEPEDKFNHVYGWEALNDSDDVLHWCLLYDTRMVLPTNSEQANQQIVDTINNEFFTNIRDFLYQD